MNDLFSHRAPQRWMKLSFKINDDLAGLAAAFIANITDRGVEQSMPPDGNPSPFTMLTGYLDNDDIKSGVEEKIRAFLRYLCGIPPTILLEEVIEEDWGINWKKHFKPVRVSSNIIVKPTWEPYLASNKEIIIEIDPGLAFGTGLHASTRLALQLIETFFSDNIPPRSVLDVGTGTGILGIAAAKFGAARVVGIDNDADAVTCAVDNIKQNCVGGTMSATGTELDALNERFDLIVANITSDVLTHLAPRLVSMIAPEGNLILAGILAGDQGLKIEQTFTELGLHLLKSPIEGEWQAFLFAS